MVKLADRMALAPGIISRESDDQLVVVFPEQGKFIVLNGTGADAFRLLDGQRTLEDIALTISEQYDAPLDRVQADVLAFAKKLIQREAVRHVRGHSQRM